MRNNLAQKCIELNPSVHHFSAREATVATLLALRLNVNTVKLMKLLPKIGQREL